MENLIYLLAEFSSEFLLFLALGIFILVCIYAAFWIVHKRRHGVIDTQLPSGPVKAYLNSMIFDAEQLRLQLFGILGAQLPPEKMAMVPQQVVISGPVDSSKLGELEGKLAEQMRALEAMTQTKAQLEKELADSKKNMGVPGANTQQAIEMKKLEEKVKLLESRLAEYNVIEDDLANLKRFQQENAALKKALASAGGSMPGGDNKPPGPGPGDSSGPPAAGGASGAASVEASGDTAAGAPGDSMVAEPEVSAESAAPSSEPESVPEPQGEASANSLLSAVSSKSEIPAGSPQVPEPKVTSPGGGSEKSEEDLVAEFEKMLKS